MEQINEIIKGCISGKRDSQEKLYKLFSKKMFGVCMLYTKDYTAAEDVMQEGFIKIFKHIGQFKNEGSFEGWVRRIMVNTALERHRKENHMYAVTDIEKCKNDLSYEDCFSALSAQDLMKLIHELSPQYRVVFSLYAIEGYSHEEISQKLSISVGTSKSNLSRARGILQQRVEKLLNISMSTKKEKVISC